MLVFRLLPNQRAVHMLEDFQLHRGISLYNLSSSAVVCQTGYTTQVQDIYRITGSHYHYSSQWKVSNTSHVLTLKTALLKVNYKRSPDSTAVCSVACWQMIQELIFPYN